jgi:hypothetical protein
MAAPTARVGPAVEIGKGNLIAKAARAGIGKDNPITKGSLTTNGRNRAAIGWCFPIDFPKRFF